eukprot:3767356-Rhodomonas_salina.1
MSNKHHPARSLRFPVIAIRHVSAPQRAEVRRYTASPAVWHSKGGRLLDRFVPRLCSRYRFVFHPYNNQYQAFECVLIGVPVENPNIGSVNISSQEELLVNCVTTFLL